LGEKGERTERITSSNFLNNSGGKKKDEEEVFFEERRFGDRSCIFFRIGNFIVLSELPLSEVI